MVKLRQHIPKAIRDRVLGEFNHRCAICGKDRPHIHHIDENPGNSDPLNLIPLCPNCHLVDQHNPTEPIDPRKLRLFRQYKNPVILKPQFHPLFSRILFLDAIEDQEIEQIEDRVRELGDFVQNLAMGSFYADRIRTMLKRRQRIYAISLYSGPDERQRAQMEQDKRDYRDQVQQSRESVHALVVELLRYQDWK